jgi:uncharacterized membrane-anchored protein YjiN (DUF445 family)
MINIDLNKEHFDKMITDALLRTEFGRAVQEKLNEVINRTLNGYDSPIKTYVENALKSHVKELLELPENAEKIKQVIANNFTIDRLNSMLEAAVLQAINLIKNYEDN